MVRVHVEPAAGYDKFLSVRVAYDRVEETEMEFFVASWRPGRYVLQHFAAGVIDFQARSADGAPLKVRKASKDSWKIAAGARAVVVSYKFNASLLDAGSTYLGENFWILNPVNFVGFTRPGLEQRHELTVSGADPTWTIATSLERHASGVFVAENFDELADSPLIVSPHLQKRSFQTRGVNFNVHFCHPSRVDDEIWRYALENFRKIVEVQIQVFGECPVRNYDYLFCFVPLEIRHAVEHAKSALFVLPQNSIASESAAKSKLLPISAHETWHIWNVKSIRPKEMTPYDYTREPTTDLHWFTEGVTDYYTQYSLLKAGIISRESFVSYFENLFASLDNNPAARFLSPAQSSLDSWLTGSPYAHPAHRISFYSLGSRVGFLLDLHMRTLSAGKAGLDDLFRLLYRRYYKQSKGIDLKALADAFGELTGQSFDAFCDKFIYGAGPPDYDYVFGPSPMKISASYESTDFLTQIGVVKASSLGSGKYVVETTAPGSPAEKRGVGAGTALFQEDGVWKAQIGERTVELRFSPDELLKNVRYAFVYSPDNPLIEAWLGR
ncbi:MAG: hypothetical protein RMM53_00940 [Bacteroidia bacterium]|nr:hypothetical protein [Bacteroidia bacterium]MDW8332761.1 hypothetical protein [Bacteroidia bacterium]